MAARGTTTLLLALLPASLLWLTGTNLSADDEIAALTAAPCGAVEPEAVEVVMRWTTAAGEEVVRRTPAGAPVPLPGAGAEEVRVTCEGPGAWCPELEEPAPGATLPLLPAAVLHGAVEVPRGEQRPQRLIVQARGERCGEPVELTREVSLEDAAFHLSVPRGELDVRLAADGWVPVYRWGVRVPPGGRGLGTVELERGGSVSGFVLDASGSPVAGADVRLEPVRWETAQETAGAEGEGDPREEWRRRTAATGPRGFFQIAGVQPGRYRLRAAYGEATARRDDVEVAADSETFFRDGLRLARRATLTVAVDPPGGAGGAPWLLHLRPLQGQSVDAGPHATDDTGWLRLEGLEPGRYRLRLTTPSGSLVGLREEVVEGSTHVPYDLALLPVVGRVSLGDEPVAAQISLSTGRADSWTFRSDEEGNFTGLVHHPGDRRRLFATVTLDRTEPGEPPRTDETPLRRRLDVKDFDVVDGRLHVDLRLGDLRLSGHVLGSAGAPVPGAVVHLDALDRHFGAAARTDPTGRFEIPALEAGRYAVAASAGARGETAPVETRLEGDLPTSVVLTIPPRRPRSGRLLSGPGSGERGSVDGANAVAGARLVVVPTVPPGPVTATTTGVDGGFTVPLPIGTRQAVVQVYAPSHLAWSACLELPPLPTEDSPAGDRPASWAVHLPPAPSGALELEVRADPDLPLLVGGETFLLTGEGGLLRLDRLEEMTGRLGRPALLDLDRDVVRARYRLAPLAAGPYTAVWSRYPEVFWAQRTCSTSLPAPAGSYLPAGGHLRMTLDHGPAQKAAER